ncbi:MAG: hypothetical protein DRN60_01720 [Thaumarchaeota archaeon]|nr:MAG: hypothetical protein DRN60_01720 [Nitrososphaerota archaeon]
MLIDVHCHLTAPEFEGRVGEVVKKSVKAGVKAIITSGLGYEDGLKALKISDYRIVYPSLGVSPYMLEGYEQVIELISRESKRIVAIGEVGLDYWRVRDDEGRDRQRRVFREFIELSKSLDLPLIIHSRSAGKYALEILFEMKAERVVMHAFDGAAKHAVKAVERGYMFSIPPSIARSQQKRNLVKRIPLENLLLESDSPVLSPVAGQVNYPWNILVSADWIGKIKGVSIEKVIEVTGRNAAEMLDLRL